MTDGASFRALAGEFGAVPLQWPFVFVVICEFRMLKNFIDRNKGRCSLAWLLAAARHRDGAVARFLFLEGSGFIIIAQGSEELGL